MVQVIVTGGSGLVGSAIKEVISKDVDLYKDHSFLFLSSKDVDLTNYDSTYNTFKNLLKDDTETYIIHLAANVGGLFKNLHNNALMFESNILINMNVLKASHNLGIQRVLSILSTCIFPDNVSYPIVEESLHNGIPHSSNCGYAYAKRMLEVQSKLYQRDFNRDYICVIPTNIFGPHDNFHLEDAHVIPALIHKCYLSKMENKPFIVMGSGKPLRQFIFSYDLAKLILWSLFIYKERENIILSVSENEEVSIQKIAEIIAEKMDYTSQLVFDTSKNDGQYKKSVSNQKLLSLYPNFKFTTIENGLDQTIYWFLDNYPNIRK
jgi:GDP-L-fucose synthase